MGKKKKTRVNFFNELVCPQDVLLGNKDFSQWYNGVLSKDEVLRNRCFSVLDYFTAYRRLYTALFEYPVFNTENISDLYCDFESEKMVVTLKTESGSLLKEDISEIYETFEPSGLDTYDSFDLIEKNSGAIKLVFNRKSE